MSFSTKIKHLTCACFVRRLSQLSFHHHYNNNNGRRRRRRRPPPTLPLHQDPYSLLKEDPIQVISDLWVRTFSDHNRAQTPKPFSNLTGFLSKLDLWVLAYQRTCADVTGSFPPRNAIPSQVLSGLLSLRNAVVGGEFMWNMKTEKPYIRSPTERPFNTISKRKLLQSILNNSSSPPPFQDCIVQEVLLMLLEPIFEPKFSPKSHGFRPGRNAHTVIRTIRSNFAGYVWFLKGDLSYFFDNVDVNALMGFVEKGVKDKKILSLISSGLKASITNECQFGDKELEKKRKKGSKRKKVLNENEAKPDPYWLRTFFDFAPQEAAKVPSYGHCGILGPLLANICFNELDHMMEDKIVEFSKPSDIDSSWRDTVIQGCHNPSWPEFVPSSGKIKTRKMDYIRFGGHFLMGIRGSRQDAVEIWKEIVEYCEIKYGVRMNNAKMEIEHVTRGIQFLDHIICHRIIHPTLRYTSAGGVIVSEKGVGTLLSVTASLQQCIRHFRRLKFVKGDRDPEPLPCTPMLYAGQAHTNAQMNKFLETMADWYRYADNRKKIVGFCAYVIRSSLAKLYAARYRLKSRARVYKIASRDLSRPLRGSIKSPGSDYSDLLSKGLVDAIEGVQFSHMSMIPSCDYTPFPRNWIPFHEQVIREYSRLQDPKFFIRLQKSVKEQGLSSPQEEIAEILWDYKTLGIWRYCNGENVRSLASEEVV